MGDSKLWTQTGEVGAQEIAGPWIPLYCPKSVDFCLPMEPTAWISSSPRLIESVYEHTDMWLMATRVRECGLVCVAAVAITIIRRRRRRRILCDWIDGRRVRLRILGWKWICGKEVVRGPGKFLLKEGTCWPGELGIHYNGSWRVGNRFLGNFGPISAFRSFISPFKLSLITFWDSQARILKF